MISKNLVDFDQEVKIWINTWISLSEWLNEKANKVTDVKCEYTEEDMEINTHIYIYMCVYEKATWCSKAINEFGVVPLTRALV